MTAFYEGKYDILLSTTIVESGLDIPTANTLIVHRADMFGLAQLYQLRGRVGRAKTRAYALFTVPANKTLTVQAERRLKVLQSLDTLGAGFQLASHDLDIRGAGNLLGRGAVRPHQGSRLRALPADAGRGGRAAQGRHRGAGGGPLVAHDRDRRAGDDPRRPTSPDLQLRLGLYRRLSTLETDEEIDAFRRRARRPLRRRCRRRSANSSRSWRSRSCAVAPTSRRWTAGRRASSSRSATIPSPIRPGLVAYVTEQASFAKVRPDMKIVFIRDVEDPDERIKATSRILRNLVRIAEKKAA